MNFVIFFFSFHIILTVFTASNFITVKSAVLSLKNLVILILIFKKINLGVNIRLTVEEPVLWVDLTYPKGV